MVKDFLEYLVKGLVEKPEAVTVTQLDNTLFELKVDDGDRGKVIGKKGRTAHAIRSLLAAISPEHESPVLDIVD